MKQIRAGGSESYTVGLLFAAAALSIVTVPIIVEMAGRLFDTPAHLPFSAVALIVFVTVIAPLLAGMTVRFFAPGLAQRIARPLSSIATVTLLIGVVPIVYAAFPAAVTLFGNGTVAAFTVFIAAGIAAGHLLGGPGSRTASFWHSRPRRAIPELQWRSPTSWLRRRNSCWAPFSGT
jgi:BASS family bile acid:Na+ symporter